jgi:hypothetical protein
MATPNVIAMPTMIFHGVNGLIIFLPLYFGLW